VAASVTPQHMLLNRNALFAVSVTHHHHYTWTSNHFTLAD
jgi:dihydroorotase